MLQVGFPGENIQIEQFCTGNLLGVLLETTSVNE